MTRVRWLAPYGDGHVVSGGDDGTVRVWSLDDAREVVCLRGHRDWVKCVATSPGGRIASCDEAGEVRIWAPDLKSTRAPQSGHLSWILAVAQPGEGHVVTAGEDGTVKWWQCGVAGEVRSVAAHDGWIRDLTIVPSLGVVTCSEDRTARLLPENQDVTIPLQARAPLWSIDYVGADTVMFGGQHGLLGSWRVGTLESRIFQALDGDIRAIRCSSEGHAIAAVTRGPSTQGQLWRCDTDGATDLLLTTGVTDIRMIAVHGTSVAAGGHGVEVWDFESRSLVARTEDVGLVRGLGWLSSEVVVLADADGIVRLWRLADGAMLAAEEFDCGFTQLSVDPVAMTVALAGTGAEPLFLSVSDHVPNGEWRSLSMIHDCDPGIDDAFALAVIAGHPEADLSGVVAVAGNVGPEATLSNALRLVRLLGLKVPVGRGSTSGLIDPYPLGAPDVHGADGLGGGAAYLPAISESYGPVEGVRLLEGEIIATGPLTDVALALRASQAIGRIVWMGGSVAMGGNVTPAAEFNAWCDPHAADEVLNSGVPMLMVPLDVTTRVPLTADDLKTLRRAGNRAQPFVVAGEFLTRAHADGHCAYLHDPVAVIAAYHPDLFAWEARTVRCEMTSELTRGLTVVDRRPGQNGPVQVAVDLDVVRVHDLIITAIVSAVRDSS